MAPSHSRVATPGPAELPKHLWALEQLKKEITVDVTQWANSEAVLPHLRQWKREVVDTADFYNLKTWFGPQTDDRRLEERLVELHGMSGAVMTRLAYAGRDKTVQAGLQIWEGSSPDNVNLVQFRFRHGNFKYEYAMISRLLRVIYYFYEEGVENTLFVPLGARAINRAQARNVPRTNNSGGQHLPSSRLNESAATPGSKRKKVAQAKPAKTLHGQKNESSSDESSKPSAKRLRPQSSLPASQEHLSNEELNGDEELGQAASPVEPQASRVEPSEHQDSSAENSGTIPEAATTNPPTASSQVPSDNAPPPPPTTTTADVQEEMDYKDVLLKERATHKKTQKSLQMQRDSLKQRLQISETQVEQYKHEAEQYKNLQAQWDSMKQRLQTSESQAEQYKHEIEQHKHNEIDLKAELADCENEIADQEKEIAKFQVSHTTRWRAWKAYKAATQQQTMHAALAENNSPLAEMVASNDEALKKMSAVLLAMQDYCSYKDQQKAKAVAAKEKQTDDALAAKGQEVFDALAAKTSALNLKDTEAAAARSQCTAMQKALIAKDVEIKALKSQSTEQVAAVQAARKALDAQLTELKEKYAEDTAELVDLRTKRQKMVELLQSAPKAAK